MSDIDPTALRLQLLQLGYRVLPDRAKAPALFNWGASDYLTREIKPGKRETEAAVVESWARRFPNAVSTGVRLEGGLAAIDADVDDEGLERAFWGAVKARAPEIAARAPARYGGGTCKVALFVRFEGDNPFVKLPNRRYARPEAITAWHAALEAAKREADVTGEPLRRVPGPDNHKVEIYGGQPNKQGNCARQFAIAGPHSYATDGSVARYYSWDEGIPALHDVALAQLPAMTHRQAIAILDDFETAATELGWQVITPPEVDDGSGMLYDIDEDTRFDTSTGRSGISYGELCDEHALHGNTLRCSSNFMAGRGWKGDRNRCSVLGGNNRHDCVVVYVHGDGITHYPMELTSPGETLLTEQLRLLKESQGAPPKALPDRITIDDFYAFMPSHQYLFVPTGDLWPAASIDARLPKIPVVKADGTPVMTGKRTQKPLELPPHLWLDRNRAVEQMTWAPGELRVITGRVATEGGWTAHEGAATYNLYRPPPPIAGSALAAGRWVELVRRIYPDYAEAIMLFCAHALQLPAVKINHALVLTGAPGIGKDTLLAPLQHGVGAWNFKEISPHHIIENYNDYMKSAVLRISETRDLGDTNRYEFYELTKTIIAAPPDMVRVNTKFIPQYYIPNTTTVVMTTNYALDGLYLPPDDRRHYVAGTEVTAAELGVDYFNEIWAWYDAGGLADVVAYLRSLDLSAFDAKAPPVKTAAFWRLADFGQASELPELWAVIHALHKNRQPPDVLTIAMLRDAAAAVKGDLFDHSLFEWLNDRKNRKVISRQLDQCGYTPVRSATEDGLWVVNKRRQVVYGRRGASPAVVRRVIRELQATHGDEPDDQGNVIPLK